MPNHISTNFRVTGPTAEVKRFINDANGNDCLLNLDSLLPMPSELRMVSSPAKIMTQAEIDTEFTNIQTAIASKADGTFTNFSFVESGSNLLIRHSGTDVMKIDSSGNLTVLGNIVANGTV